MEKGEAIITDTTTALYVSYEDYDVEMFGGSDYEVSYTLDSSGRDQLELALKEEGFSGSLRDMILAHFGVNLEQDSFAAYCDAHGIKYDLFTRIS